MKLRHYQTEAVNKIRGSFQLGQRSPILVVPTGGGKTVIFSHIAKTSSSRDKRVLILVHRRELLKQASKALIGVNHGLINPKFTADFTANIQIASVQTVINRLDKYESFDLIIIDEAHHAIASSYRKVLDHYSNARVLGVTATPIRADGRGLGTNSGGIFDDIIIGPTVKQLIEEGFLVKPIIYAPLDKIDFSSVKKTMGDFDKKETALKVDKSTITGDAVAHYAKICPSTPAVVFCINIVHAEHVAQEFINHGFSACSIDGTMDSDERTKILDDFASGKILVLTSVDLVGEGFDLPAIGCAIMLRPTMSLGLYIQQAGRALRPCVGKDRAIILDHVGNVLMHGLIDDVREWSLDGEEKKSKKGKKEKAIRTLQCDSCYCVHEPLPSCPQCGYVYVTKSKTIKTEAGELQEITSETASYITKMRRVQIAGADSLEKLKELERASGYKKGWAEHVHASRVKKTINI